MEIIFNIFLPSRDQPSAGVESRFLCFCFVVRRRLQKSIRHHYVAPFSDIVYVKPWRWAAVVVEGLMVVTFCMNDETKDSLLLTNNNHEHTPLVVACVKRSLPPIGWIRRTAGKVLRRHVPPLVSIVARMAAIFSLPTLRLMHNNDPCSVHT